jgi:hypothetical protein
MVIFIDYFWKHLISPNFKNVLLNESLFCIFKKLSVQQITQVYHLEPLRK